MFSILPTPQSYHIFSGEPFVFAPEMTQFVLPLEWNTSYMQATLSRLGLVQQNCERKVVFEEDVTLSHHEGYSLKVSENQIVIRAMSYRGAVWALQTLMQCLPPAVVSAPLTEVVQIPPMKIEDAPQYDYRGAHLDVCRHFFTVAEIQKFIDELVLHKINVFHWHLTEDQAWRIEIKKYPKLVEVGAVREASPVMWKRTELDGVPYGPFYYTQEEIKFIVAYAKERGVEVIPEIELPGHAQAALAAYPELGCTGGPYAPWCHWGISENVYCAGNDATLAFLKDVIREVSTLFESSYIHIGGDECPKTQWEKCPKCQARMATNDLANTHELQSWFITQIGHFIQELGKKMIGWDEILEGGIPPSSIVMSWQGIAGGLTAAKAKHQVIMTPNTHLYFDYGQGSESTEPESIGGYVGLETVYDFNVDCGLPEEYRPFVLGAQANCWSEYFFDFARLEYALLPRLAALSEITWRAPIEKNYIKFREKVAQMMLRYETMGANYRKLDPLES